MTDSQRSAERDQGAILLLVLAVAIVLSLVVLALANFVAADLRYTQVMDSRAKTLSSAESGIDYAVDRLRRNQTLCASKAAAGPGPVSLSGSATSPVGTPLSPAINGTTTRISCQRLDNSIADVAGWAVVITDSPGPDRLQMDMVDTAHVKGSVFVPNPAAITTNTSKIVSIEDADLWYNASAPSCATPSPLSVLHPQPGLQFVPSAAHGLECTTRLWNDVFTEPAPTLPTNMNPFPDDTTHLGCRVFSPGHYTVAPVLSSNVYFKSGDYHFDFSGEWLIAGSVIWAGNAPSETSPFPNSACIPARTADTIDPIGGATFYLNQSSSIKVGSGGALEIFSRRQPDNHTVSIQALSTSTAPGTEKLGTTSAAGLDLILHGLVWIPNGRIRLDNDQAGVLQQFLGGIVTQRLHLDRFDEALSPPGLSIRAATGAVKTRILFSSTSTTADGVSTTVEAVVEYRPDAADPDDRVAVGSFRVVD